MLATQFNSVTEPQRQAQSGLQQQRQIDSRTAKARRAAWDRVSLFGCIVVCAMAGWFLASTSARTAGLNQQIYQMQTQIKQDTAVNAAYSAKLDGLTQPSHILAIAAKMGLKPAHTLNIPAQGVAGAN